MNKRCDEKEQIRISILFNFSKIMQEKKTRGE